MHSQQYVRYIPRKPPQPPPFRDVIKGEGTTELNLADPGRRVFEPRVGADVENVQMKNALNPEICAEASRAVQSLQKLHIDQRQDKLRPIVTHEEVCLNEELRDRFGAVINYTSY